jgi:hypothetical protein
MTNVRMNEKQVNELHYVFLAFHLRSQWYKNVLYMGVKQGHANFSDQRDKIMVVGAAADHMIL